MRVAAARVAARAVPEGRRKGTCALWLKRNWVLGSLVGMAAASAALSVLLYLEPCGGDAVHHAQGRRDPQCHELREPHRFRERAAAAVAATGRRGRRRRWRWRRAPSQVTVFETVIELKNVTTTQNVSVLVNETVKYNAACLQRPFFASSENTVTWPVA